MTALHAWDGGCGQVRRHLFQRVAGGVAGPGRRGRLAPVLRRNGLRQRRQAQPGSRLHERFQKGCPLMRDATDARFGKRLGPWHLGPSAQGAMAAACLPHATQLARATVRRAALESGLAPESTCSATTGVDAVAGPTNHETSMASRPAAWRRRREWNARHKFCVAQANAANWRRPSLMPAWLACTSSSDQARMPLRMASPCLRVVRKVPGQ